MPVDASLAPQSRAGVRGPKGWSQRFADGGRKADGHWSARPKGENRRHSHRQRCSHRRGARAGHFGRCHRLLEGRCWICGQVMMTHRFARGGESRKEGSRRPRKVPCLPCLASAACLSPVPALQPSPASSDAAASSPCFHHRDRRHARADLCLRQHAVLPSPHDQINHDEWQDGKGTTFPRLPGAFLCCCVFCPPASLRRVAIVT